MPKKIGYFLDFERRDQVSEYGVPYREIAINSFCDEPGLDVTIRRYPKRTFVAYEDNRDNQSGGYDIDDCWLAPTIIVAKISNKDFDIQTVLEDCAVKIGLASTWPYYREIVVNEVKSLLQ